MLRWPLTASTITKRNTVKKENLTNKKNLLTYIKKDLLTYKKLTINSYGKFLQQVPKVNSCGKLPRKIQKY